MNKTITGTQVPAANEAILAALRKVHNIASPASTAPEDLKRQRLGQETLGRLLTPPTLIQVGGREILRDDSTRLHQNLQAAGVPAVLQTWPEMWHVFQMFPLKAAGEAMDQMARYLELLR